MGTTKQKNGDGHIIFHVGKELPSKGSNFMLVPGIQKAQGRGVYFSDQPRLKYSGGEVFQKDLSVTPIFCVPMNGIWIRGKNKKKNEEISYHSDEKVIALFGLKSFDGVVDGVPVKYYYPSEVSFFQEPDTEHHGRHITSRFSDSILEGRVNFSEAIRQLREEHQIVEHHVESQIILQKMAEAMESGRLPKNSDILIKLSELHGPKVENKEMKVGLH